MERRARSGGAATLRAWRHALMAADLARLLTSRSAKGYEGYKTPEIHWDRATATGKPFFYFAFGCPAAAR